MQSRHGHFSVVQTLILFLNIDNIFSPMIESGTSSYILGVKDKELSYPKWFAKYLLLLIIDASLRPQLLLVNSNNSLRKDLA